MQHKRIYSDVTFIKELKVSIQPKTEEYIVQLLDKDISNSLDVGLYDDKLRSLQTLAQF